MTQRPVGLGFSVGVVALQQNFETRESIGRFQNSTSRYEHSGVVVSKIASALFTQGLASTIPVTSSLRCGLSSRSEELFTLSSSKRASTSGLLRPTGSEKKEESTTKHIYRKGVYECAKPRSRTLSCLLHEAAFECLAYCYKLVRGRVVCWMTDVETSWRMNHVDKSSVRRAAPWTATREHQRLTAMPKNGRERIAPCVLLFIIGRVSHLTIQQRKCKL